MTLYEKQQSQGQWQDRLEQERRNISISVEEAMMVGTDEQQSESDEENAPGETQNGVQTSEKNLVLIPPRLSLQSKMLPAIRSESFVKSATAAHAAFQQSEAQEKQQTKRQTASQTNIFTRLAQRLTSSFTAVSSMEQIPPSPLPTVSTHPLTSASHSEQLSNLRENQIISISPTPLVREIPGHVSPVSPPAKIIDAIPATPSTRPSMVQQQTGPQRLAGYTTKVRLQTASHPQTTPLPAAQSPDTVLEGQKRDLRESFRYDEQQVLREPLEIHLNIPDISKVSTRPDLVAVSVPQESKHEQAEQEKFTSVPIPTHQTFFGSHAFEAGQAEVMVAQEQVQLSSVVYVMLTSNPGQTLIQYVSLHPQVGFTVHLTAPASSKTTFNYALLVQPQDAQIAL